MTNETFPVRHEYRCPKCNCSIITDEGERPTHCQECGWNSAEPDIMVINTLLERIAELEAERGKWFRQRQQSGDMIERLVAERDEARARITELEAERSELLDAKRNMLLAACEPQSTLAKLVRLRDGVRRIADQDDGRGFALSFGKELRALLREEPGDETS